LVIALGIIIITKSYQSPLWIAIITLVVIALLQIRSAAIRTINHKQEVEEEENNISLRKRKKKFPKHRKDYK
jgi:beta-lactamase regulating signal transducer with metallopeptidase domain